MKNKPIFKVPTCELTEAENGILKIQFGDGKNNCLNRATTQSMANAIQLVNELNDRKKVPFLILEGAGDRNFCTGIDLHELEITLRGVLDTKLGLEQLVRHIGEWAKLFDLIHRLGKNVPIVSFVKGRAYGAGLTIATLTNFSFVQMNSKFKNSSGEVVTTNPSAAMPEVRLGLSYPCISTPYLINKIGIEAMLDYLSTNYQHFKLGTKRSFDEASLHGESIVSSGLVDHLLPNEEAVSIVKNELNEIHASDNCIKNLGDLLVEYKTPKRSGFGGESIRRTNIDQLTREVRNLPRPGENKIVDVTSNNFANQLLSCPEPLFRLCKKLRAHR